MGEDPVKPENKKESNSYIFTIDEKTRPPFSIGTTVNMDAKKKDGEKLRFTANLLGWVQFEYLLISSSYESSIMLLPVGTRIIARYLFEGQIYGFATQLMYKQSDPFPLWFLRFPVQIEVINLRDSSRYPIVWELKDSDGINCYTRDISKSGVSIIYQMSDAELKKNIGDFINVSFNMPDGTAVNSLKGKIVRKYVDINQVILGVTYSKDNKIELEKVHKYINKLADIYKWIDF